MLSIQIEFEQLLDTIDKLSSEQHDIIRRRLNKAWSTELKQTLDAIHAKVPPDFAEDKIQEDIEFAINDVRYGKG